MTFDGQENLLFGCGGAVASGWLQVIERASRKIKRQMQRTNDVGGKSTCVVASDARQLDGTDVVAARQRRAGLLDTRLDAVDNATTLRCARVVQAPVVSGGLLVALRLLVPCVLDALSLLMKQFGVLSLLALLLDDA